MPVLRVAVSVVLQRPGARSSELRVERDQQSPVAWVGDLHGGAHPQEIQDPFFAGVLAVVVGDAARVDFHVAVITGTGKVAGDRYVHLAIDLEGERANGLTTVPVHQIHVYFAFSPTPAIGVGEEQPHHLESGGTIEAAVDVVLVAVDGSARRGRAQQGQSKSDLVHVYPLSCTRSQCVIKGVFHPQSTSPIVVLSV